MAQHYLQTKLYPPQLLKNYVIIRSQLLERLQTNFPRKLTLVSASAGFGKTTLISQWIATLPTYQLAWLSLDKADSQPARFWGYVITALQTIWPDIGAGLLPLLVQLPPPPIPNLLIELLNQLTLQDEAIMLVLDDYHLIENETVHEQLNFFIDHLPPNCHLVINTRSEPPFSVGRLRVSRQLVALGTEDLRFDVAETTQFLNQFMALSLTDEEITILADRTEGWVAGLQLAGLALQNQPNQAEFVQNFSGSHAYLFDYLTAELFHTQSETVQQFLLKTSILQRLTGPLCEAVLADEATINGQELLIQLHQSNLLLVPLDNQQIWYRYHHLFTDLLQTTLQRRYPEQINTYHARACAWYMAQGELQEALPHALAGEIYPQAVIIMEQLGPQMLGRGEIMALKHLLEQLPEAVITTSSYLCCFHAWVFKLIKDNAAISKRLEEAEKALEQPGQQPFIAHASKAAILALRGYLAGLDYDLPSAVQYLQAAQQLAPPEQPVLGNAVAMGLGTSYLFKANFVEAKRTFTQTIEAAEKIGSWYIALGATGYLICTYLMEGNLHAADQLCQQTITRMENHPQRNLLSFGHIYLRWVQVLYEWNELEQAELYLRRGEMLLEQSTLEADLAVWDTLGLVPLHLAQENQTAAQQAIEVAQQAIDQSGEYSFLAPFHHKQVRLWLQVDPNLAIRWANHYQRERQRTRLPWAILSDLALARVWLHQQKFAEALTLLTDNAAETTASLGWHIEGLLLQSLAHQGRQHTSAALEMLGQALVLAKPHGFIRLFVDEGPRLATLLQQCPHESTYAQFVLHHFPTMPPQPKKTTMFVEPLNERERAILDHLAQGYSTPEIADALVLSKNTIKWYLKNIYSKLGVRRRSQAIAMARQHRIIN